MGYEAFAQWLNIEMPLAKNLAQDVSDALQSAQEKTFIGKEYSLFLCKDEVIVKANGLAIDEMEVSELEEDLSLCADDAFAACGREDFEHFFQAYLEFIH